MGKNSSEIFLMLNGIPSKTPPDFREVFFYSNVSGEWSQNASNTYYEVENTCVLIHSLIYSILHVNRPEYKYATPPYYLSSAGLSSDVKISKSSFEKLLGLIAKSDEMTRYTSNREMYLHDLQKLVTGIQGCNEEIGFLLGEFYERLNNYSVEDQHNDGVYWSKDRTVVNINLALNFIYIRMYSSLDYMVKLLYEIQNFQSSYNSYVNLKSNGLLFGDKKKINLDSILGTVFEDCSLISEIETFRHFIVHDSFLDDLPRVYISYKEGIEVEKYILKPDMTNGRLDKYKNRRLFYGEENKWNLSLIGTIEEFRTRQVKTLEFAVQELRRIINNQT